MSSQSQVIGEAPTLARRGTRVYLKHHRNAVLSLATFLVIAGLWELASVLNTHRSAAGAPLVPGWEWVFTDGFRAIANYGGNGLGLTPSEAGGSYGGASKVLLTQSEVTWLRYLAGLCGGVLIGSGLALALSWSRWLMRLVGVPAHVFRMIPLLALIPLFQLWFGLSFSGIFTFVAYGVAVIMFVGTLTAFSNVPQLYIDNARTLGASSFQIYKSVVLPAIFPELRSAILLSIGLSWTLVVASEFLGAQSGLGFIISSAYSFALLDRMFVVSLLLLIYAGISFAAFAIISKQFVKWLPES